MSPLMKNLLLMSVLLFALPHAGMAESVSIKGLDHSSSDLFITGVTHGILGVVGNDLSKGRESFFCPPDDLAISTDLIITLVGKYQTGEIPGDVFPHAAVYALENEYPCD